MTMGSRLLALGLALALLSTALPPVASAQQPMPPPPAPREQTSPAAAGAAAVAVNLFRVPGKVVLCAGGTVLATALMLISFGTQYRPAGAILDEGCGGKWVLGPSDLPRDNDGPKVFDPERR